MASNLTGVFCGRNGSTYGVSIECQNQADCILISKLPGFTCNQTAGGGVQCSNGGDCGNSNFTNSFTLRNDNGLLSSSNSFNVAGRQSSLDVNYTATANRSISANATSTNATLTNTTSTNTTSTNVTSTTTPTIVNASATSSLPAPAASTSEGAAAAVLFQPKSWVYTAFSLWIVAFLFLPGVAAAASAPKTPYSLDRDSNVNFHLPRQPLTERAKGSKREGFRLPDLAEQLIGTAADVVSSDSGSTNSSSLSNGSNGGNSTSTGDGTGEGLGQEIFDGLRDILLPPVANIGVDLAEGRPEDAAKDAIKDVVEGVLDKVLLGVAPETLGASLLLLFVAHIAVDIAVDELFKGADVLLDLAANETQHSACDAGDFSASPWFAQTNLYGSDDWKDCKACCADWAKTVLPGQAGCDCCASQEQQNDPSLHCCPQDYFSTCCSTECPRPVLCITNGTVHVCGDDV